MSPSDSMTLVSSQRVEVLCDLERWADALPLASLLLATDPDNDMAWCLLAQCQLGLGRYDSALSAAQRAAALAPDSDWPYRLISFAATCLGRHDDAVRAARTAVRLDPEAWQTHARLAAAAVRQQAGRGRNEAASAAARALALAPDEPQVQLIFGTVAASRGEQVVAERAYRTALHLDPQNSGGHHLLATLHLRRRLGSSGLARAATGFATALGADPTAQASRRSLDLTLRLFLGRTAYGLFGTAYLSLLWAVHSAPWSRAIAVLLIALPVLYVIDFLRRLSRQLRSFLWHLLRRGPIASSVGLAMLCVILLSAGVVAGQWLRPGLAAAATIIALLARLVLYLGSRAKAPGRRLTPGTTP